MLYHFSDQSDIARFKPRLIDGCQEPVIWAIDAARQCNYLLPRDCPRVTCYAGLATTVADRERLLGDHRAVVAIESAWLERVNTTTLYRYHLPATGFTCIDLPAGYFVSRSATIPTQVDVITDLPSAITADNAELRVLASLWPLHDEILASTLEFSMIRMRNAQPRIANLAPPSPLLAATSAIQKSSAASPATNTSASSE
jgi:hypothetical protein